MTPENSIDISDFVLGDAVLLDRQPSVVTATAILRSPVWGLEGFAMLTGSNVLLGACSPEVGGVVIFEKVEFGVLPEPVSQVVGELRVWSPDSDPATGAQMAPYSVECHQGGNTPVITVFLDGEWAVFLPRRSVDRSEITVLPVPKVLYEAEEQSSFWESLYQAMIRGFGKLRP